MTLMEALYQYASEERLFAYLAGTGYNRRRLCMERRERDLRAALDEEQTLRLEQLLDGQFDLRCMEDDALFRLGVSIGLELSRI